MVTYCFVIAQHSFIVHAEREIVWQEEHTCFMTNVETANGYPRTVYYITAHDSEPDLSGYPLIYHQGSQYVYQGPGGQLRAHYLIGTEISIICEERRDGYHISIERLFWEQSYMYWIAMMLEKVLLESDALILHSAYVRYQGEAILFTAPSGTGKSTQADLWKRYRKCEIINGDRSVLQKRDGRWYACGFPICGSSKICYNIDTPLKAIVYLSQAPENRVERLKGAQALQKLMSEISINYWDRTAVSKSVALMTDILKEIPFYHLSCTIDKEAVDILAATLGYESN